MDDEYWSEQGDYLSGVAEDYYYATHPDPRHPMTAQEKLEAIRAYVALLPAGSQ